MECHLSLWSTLSSFSSFSLASFSVCFFLLSISMISSPRTCKVMPNTLTPRDFYLFGANCPRANMQHPPSKKLQCYEPLD